MSGISEVPEPTDDDRWFVTFGFGWNLSDYYSVLGRHATQTDALLEVGEHWGYTTKGAVRCAFVYPIAELAEQVRKYGIREVPLGAHLFKDPD